MSLFIDTWGWLTLRDRCEARHAEVERFYRNFRRRRGIAYTSDYVLEEGGIAPRWSLQFANANGPSRNANAPSAWLLGSGCWV